MLPNNTQSTGAKRYTYNSAGYLTQVESHNGTAYTAQATMTLRQAQGIAYNGLGQRQSMDASGVIAYYVMDGNRPLTAESNGNTTSYLYGLGVIGEENNTWSYSLTDGTNTQRQLTDATGEVTYSARYTPWGDTLDSSGTGNFTFGYFGGLMDEATGLLYTGNGQYYDPQTGRFLTRGVNPNSTNPYLPFDPTGTIIGPMGILAIVLSRKKKKSKYDVLLLVLVFAVASGMAISACGPGEDGDGSGNPPTIPPGTPTPTPTPSETPSPSPTVPSAPTNTPTIPCPPDFEHDLISFGSGWDPDEIEIVMDAISTVGQRLSPYVGGIDCLEAFFIAYRISKGFPLTFITAQDIGQGECKAASRGIVKCGGNVKMDDSRWMVHEFGYLLQHSRYKDDTQGPYASLKDPDAAIVDDLGNWVTGTQPNGVFKRTMLGYLSSRQPDVYHGPKYYDDVLKRSLGYKTWDSNNQHEARNEDVADMYMNWVYDTFDKSGNAYGAGVKRYDWVEKNISAWVNNANY